MTATTQRKREIELAEAAVGVGAALDEAELALRDARLAMRRMTNLFALLGGRPGPDFVEAA